MKLKEKGVEEEKEEIRNSTRKRRSRANITIIFRWKKNNFAFGQYSKNPTYKFVLNSIYFHVLSIAMAMQV